MTSISANLIGGLGNKLHIWAHAKSYAEQNGHELRTPPWVGEKIFTLGDHECKRPGGTETEVLSGYFQSQKDLIYTRADCRRWFKLKPAIEAALEASLVTYRYNLPYAHFRRGDYAGAGYPLISKKAVEMAMIEHGIIGPCVSVSDDEPLVDPAFTGDLSMLPDFYRLMRAPILFRANSTFSWWAATLGYGRIFSPVITGLLGGIEHDNVPYVPGNHTRCAELEFVTDLHLKEI